MSSIAGDEQINLLHSKRFDTLLIAGTTFLALIAWTAVQMDSDWFYPILITDLWLLGYHHVIATYTRIGSDWQTVWEHRFLTIGLPVLVIAGVATLAFNIGLIAIASIYLYWQWFHYLRQSEGISKAYLGKSGMGQSGANRYLRVFFYGLPLASFLTMIDRQPAVFLNMPVWTFPVNDWLLLLLWCGALAAGMVFLLQQWRNGQIARLSRPWLLYMASHALVFVLGYAVTEQINHGWLAINIWHNAQYLLFVWLFNTRRYAAGPQKRGWFVSYISQPQRAWLYLLALLTLTTLFYFS